MLQIALLLSKSDSYGVSHKYPCLWQLLATHLLLMMLHGQASQLVLSFSLTLYTFSLPLSHPWCIFYIVCLHLIIRWHFLFYFSILHPLPFLSLAAQSNERLVPVFQFLPLLLLSCPEHILGWNLTSEFAESGYYKLELHAAHSLTLLSMEEKDSFRH